ncbi:MAG: phosphatidylserine synthase [Acidobacteria bacterium]|nr:phosphatidylserine synthase [Acidobacteriota bacterium]
MKLLIQPSDGLAPLIRGINGARNRVEIIIFRFDRGEIQRALASAVKRGVFVHALIAHINRQGQENLRELETQLLAAGVTVARTADDLSRYHGKMMIIDRRELYLLSFNLTYLDIERSRAFGIITTNRKLVQEAVRLFEADTKRHPYDAGLSTLIVSPSNARKQLSGFIEQSKHELLIYDPRISDPAMIRLLSQRANAGVAIKIIGQLTGKSPVPVRRLSSLRLHTRTMIRDGRAAFVGSQSLREIELDGRREVGLVFRDRRVVSRLAATFQEDWSESGLPKAETADLPAAKTAKRVAKAVARQMPSVTPVLDVIVQEMASEGNLLEIDSQQVEETVKSAVKEAVKEVVQDAIEETSAQVDP